MTTLIAVPALWVPYAHTVIAGLAFSTALLIGWMSGLWKELCKNSVASWPIEWFPSVSATIGDHALPRAPSQILIALCATPRFLLILVQWLVHRYAPHARDVSSSRSVSKAPTTKADEGARSAEFEKKAGEMIDSILEPLEEATKSSSGSGADVEMFVGIARTLCCGGWVYITSRDQHDLHDLFMILYLILTLPWMFLSTQNSTSQKSRRRRQLAFAGFLLTIPPLIWLYYRHSVMRIPGAYTYYAFFEWSLVFWDVGFDAIAATELGHLRIAVIDTSESDGDDKLLNPLGEVNQRVFIRPIPARAAAKPDLDWTSAATEHGAMEKLHRYWPFMAYSSDVYFAVCFWTVFTSLGFQLFYWSVWKLALAGSELALIANLSAYMLSSPANVTYVTSRRGMLTHRTIHVVAGMGVYCVPSVAMRFVGIALGTWTGWLPLYGNWARLKGSPEMLVEGKILSIGLVITLVIKYASASNNPLSATMNESTGGWNKTGLVLAAAASIEYANRPLNLYPAPPMSYQAGKKDVAPFAPPSKSQQRLVSIGLGALIHLVQTFATDSGTIIAWTWTGYPITGPTLHPFAGVVIAAAAIGPFLPLDVLGLPWAMFGCTGAVLLYGFQDWIGFLGGLMLVTYLTSILPPYLRAASVGKPASTFGNAQLINILLDVASVVTVAYAFVPLGWILRERTDLILGFSKLCIVSGGLAAKSIHLPGIDRLQLRSRQRIDRTSRWSLTTSITLSVLALALSYSKMPTTNPKPYYPNHRIFTGGIWAVHFGVDESGRDSQRRIMELVRDMQVDVLGLLETDLHRFVYGNRDLTRVIADELGYYVDLGPGPNQHTWGAALLSKCPIINSTHHLLPSPHGELAPAIHATLDVHGERVDVLVSHNGQEEDALDRELQTTEIARLLNATYPTPTVFLGYLVTHTGDPRPWPYQILMEDGKMYDIEISDTRRWCEYIAFRGLWRIGFARLHESDITDTELQVGKFLLAKPNQDVVYETNEEMYWHIGEADIPEPWRMPSMFRGNGTRGHVYRVWDGPLYYMPPPRSGLQRYGWEWGTSLDA